MTAAYDDRDGKIWMDGELVEWRDANVHVLTHALHYASSVFEGERCYDGKIFKGHEHSLRLIESAATKDGRMQAFADTTDIFIYPGYQFRVTDGLMTNFHLPKSTLLMLVSALMGVQRIKDIYDHALDREYRFFSYGDASLLLP